MLRLRQNERRRAVGMVQVGVLHDASQTAFQVETNSINDSL